MSDDRKEYEMNTGSENEHNRTSVWQVIKFTLFSASAGLIQISTFALFLDVFHWAHWLSYLISLILSVIWNFTFNRRYTFRSDANVQRSMLLVALFYAVFTPVSTWWSNALGENGAGWNPYVVEIGTMLVNFVLEFLYQRFVVYRNRIDTNDVAARAKR